ncbi:MAG: hypothetical protein ACXVZU_03520 [Methanobacteriaceae archaeon]
MIIAPTTLQRGDDLRVDDYRRKSTIKADHFCPAFILWAILQSKSLS